MITKAFDAIIIGTGQAGTPLAGRLSEAGLRVAIIERHLVGGTCVNTGCKPTKTLVASAYAAQMARRGADYGVETGPIRVDMAKVHARSRQISVDSRAANETRLRSLPNCTLIFGHARFEGRQTVAVGGERFTAPRIFVNVGGRASIPDFPGVGTTPLLTNSSLLDLATLPDHLVVVGGSYIGLEFGQAYRRFGSAVTIVERGPRLIGREDPDSSDALKAILEEEGIAVRLGAECIRFERRGSATAVCLDCVEGSREIVGSHVLLAVGRRPNTDDLGLDTAELETDDRGFIIVDDELRTTAPGVWALGDCNGRGAFTHTSYNDFEIVAANLLDGASRKLSDRIPAYALFTDPPLGRVGMTETEAREQGHQVRVGMRPMTRVGRAVEKDETKGFMKVVVGTNDRILGAAILGTGGDEAVHGVLEAMYAGVTATAYTRTVAIHPTVSELISTIFGELLP